MPNKIVQAKVTENNFEKRVVDCPKSIPEYTKGMGDVDRL